MRKARRLLAVVPRWLLATAAGMLFYAERGRPLRRSTVAFFQSAGRQRWRQAVHGYVYARWSNQYIGFARSWITPHRRQFQSNWADHYHGKVLPHNLAHRLLTLDHDVDLPDQDQVIPYPVARDIVIRNPQDIAIYDCPCRSTREHPCLPIDVCMIVGQPWVDFMLDHNSRSARRVSQAEALAILDAEHQRGHVHTAYFKDAMEGRFYAICNCCKCCCGGIEAMVRGGSPMIASSGFISQIDEYACTACGQCAEACPFEAITINGHAMVDAGKCMGCGVCEVTCQLEIPVLVRDTRKPLPLDLSVLEAQAIAVPLRP